MSMWGSIRSSQRGSHQADSPISERVAGASVTTRMPASSTAVARPTPNCLIVGTPMRMKLGNAGGMMRQEGGEEGVSGEAGGCRNRGAGPDPRRDRPASRLAAEVVPLDVADQEDLV